MHFSIGPVKTILSVCNRCLLAQQAKARAHLIAKLSLLRVHYFLVLFLGGNNKLLFLLKVSSLALDLLQRLMLRQSKCLFKGFDPFPLRLHNGLKVQPKFRKREIHLFQQEILNSFPSLLPFFSGNHCGIAFFQVGIGHVALISIKGGHPILHHLGAIKFLEGLIVVERGREQNKV